MDKFERVVVGTDGSEHAQVAVEKAVSLAKLLQKPLVAVYVVDPIHYQGLSTRKVLGDLEGALLQEAAEVLQRIRVEAEAAGVVFEAVTREGRPAEELCAAATDRDIVVVATHGRRGLGRILMGSVAENVVRHAPCPVLVVRDRTWKQRPRS